MSRYSKECIFNFYWRKRIYKVQLYTMYTNYQNLKETVKLEADFWACGQCPCIKSEIITNLNIVYWVQNLRVINIQYVKVFLPAWLKKRNIPSVLINCKTLSCLHRSWMTLNSGFNACSVGALSSCICRRHQRVDMWWVVWRIWPTGCPVHEWNLYQWLWEYCFYDSPTDTLYIWFLTKPEVWESQDEEMQFMASPPTIKQW